MKVSHRRACGWRAAAIGVVTAVFSVAAWLRLAPLQRAGRLVDSGSTGRPPSGVERRWCSKGFLKPEWREAAYRNAGGQWEQPAPDPDKDPAAYAAAFRHHYGLHPAPYPNDGLPMGLRRGHWPGGAKIGLQIDCMVCHGGSIGGQSYVGLGNTQLDLKAVLFELTIADGKRPPFSTFVLNSSRGTNNAGQVAAVLLSLRNSDLSVRARFRCLWRSTFPRWIRRPGGT